MAATTAIVRAQPAPATTRRRSSGRRPRKAVTKGEVMLGAAGGLAAGAAAAGLHRLGMSPTVAAVVVGGVGAAGALALERGGRAFAGGAALGAGSMLASEWLAAIGRHLKDEKAKEEAKQLAASTGNAELVAGAPAAAKDGNGARNAPSSSITDQMRQQINAAMRQARAA